MDIKTKYDLRQSVFYMDNNKVKEGVIERIYIGVQYKLDDIKVRYPIVYSPQTGIMKMMKSSPRKKNS